MPESRYSPRLNITMPPSLLRQVDEAVIYYGAPRSVIIRFALQDWLERHIPIKHQLEPETVDDKPKIPEVDPDIPLRELIKPNMSAEEVLVMIEAYKTAQKIRYN